MPEENTKKVHPTIRITASLLIIYGVVVIIYGIIFILYPFYPYFLGTIEYIVMGKITGFLEWLVSILLLIGTPAYFFMIIFLALMLFSAAKQLIDGKKEGASMGIGGVLTLVIFGSFYAYKHMYEDDMLFRPLLWFVYNIFLLYLLASSKTILKK